MPQSRNSSFPRRRESRSVSAGTYRAKRLPKPRVLDSHFRGNDGS
ncbi:pilus assembly protein PilS, partial [Neisseria gonorrhoeae]